MMRKNCLVLLMPSLLVACSTIPNEFSSPKKNQITLSELQKENYHELLWNKQPIYITFTVQNGKLLGRSVEKSVPNAPKNKNEFYCLHLDKSGNASVCKGFDIDVYSSRKWRTENMILGPIVIALSPLGILTDGPAKTVDAIQDSILGPKKLDQKIITEVSRTILNNIVSEYEYARKNIDDLLNFMDKYKVKSENRSIINDLVIIYNASSSPSVQKKVEAVLINPSFFSIKADDMKVNSESEAQVLNAGLAAFAGTYREVHQWVNVSLNQNLGIKFKNSYKIKLKASYEYSTYKSVSGFIGMSSSKTSSKIEEIVLSPQNNYQQNVKITLDNLPSAININVGLYSIDSKLENIKPESFEVIDIEVLE